MRRVIRISRAHDCRRAKDILSLNDTTDAGLVISPKEEDIEGVDCGLLAVIVGELLPQAEKEPPQQTLSSPLADQGDHDQIYESSTSGKVVSFINTVVSAYNTFPSKTYLQHVIGRFRTSEQTSLVGLSTPGVASRAVIRDMMEGKGDLIEEQAECVIDAFKELWPYQFEAVGEHRINISAVVELAKGLYSISASGITIHESLYLGVIVSFCTMFSNSHAMNAGVGEYRDNLIQSAISIARGSASAPMTVRPLAQTVDGNPGVALLEVLIRDKNALLEHLKAWHDAGRHPRTHGCGLGQLHKAVQLASVVLGTQNKEATVTALTQVKRLAVGLAFEMPFGSIPPGDCNIKVIPAILQAAVHVVATDVVEKFATQADLESDAMDAQPTLPGLPANSAKLADKFSALYHALGSVKEEGARGAVGEAIRDYEEEQEEDGEEAPGSSSILGLCSSLDQKDAALLRYMRQVFEKERDSSGSQDLDKELAWASRLDWK
ncbi:hypothetical protein CEP51_006766 [Fusarium floridanum]|uniref:Uncharacterized protein n=1 Tax=Fusarium floridanum TaxID=1325733 RepID=A0A428RRG2_9HYPO|nr:hypothetical protein CEP51_006766 [Fusarium floridanum]